MNDAARIQRLSPVLASQIAAGEVIERPASVIKELLENSLDAGASRIQIDVEAAGSRLIRVRDNGHGIHPEDLALAIAPHGTSKIRNINDLAAIASLGFRGEALASIASVARLELCSKRHDQAAMALQVEPEQPLAEAVPAAHPDGTTVEVRDLFFNVPARRKFLRTEQTEWLQILDLVKSLSLSRPRLGIQLSHNNRRVFSLGSAASQAARIGQVFGKAFAQQAYQLDFSAHGIHIRGCAGSPAAARSQADRQYVFLNGRLIRDRRLLHALRLAYAGSLPGGRFAPFLVYIDMDPAAFDINVHPTKHEVRFRAARQIHDALYTSMHQALLQAQPVQFPDTAESAAPIPAAVREVRTPAYMPAPAYSQPLSASTVATHTNGSMLLLDQRYLLVEDHSRLLLIDGRRAWQWLQAGELRNASLPLAGRPLLLPVNTSATPRQLGVVEQTQSLLQSFGIRLEQTAPAQLSLRALPVVAVIATPETFLTHLLTCLQQITAENLLPENAAAKLRELLAEQAAASANLQAPALQTQLVTAIKAATASNDLPVVCPWKWLDAAQLAGLLAENR
ncbi:MAG: DNA mismatch repair endonuclease MutL [Gammaproteobacteria bacterium]